MEITPEVLTDIRERYHAFIAAKTKIFRYNQIWRRCSDIHGAEVASEYLFTNFAPVLYPLVPENITITL